MRTVVALSLVVAACRPTPTPSSSTPVPPEDPVPPGCRSADPDTIATCVDPVRYAADVGWIAQPRPPGSPHHIRVQARCAETFERWGYEVVVDRYETGANVFGIRPGDRPAWLLFGAHYDHIPGCAGADDNASGVAAVLELSRVLAGTAGGPTLAFACWDEEERGLVGSRDWARRRGTESPAVELYVNFDAIAFTDPRPRSQRVPAGFSLLFADEVAELAAREHRADFIAFIADPAAVGFARRLQARAQRQALPATVLEIPRLVKESHLIYDLQRSDHAALWDIGIPAVMVTDTAEFRSEAYHCRGRADDLGTLDLAFATRVVRTVAGAAVDRLAGAPPTPPAEEPAQ